MPGSPERFVEHVDRVVDRLAGECADWLTIAEPNVLAAGGWVTGQLPPGRRGALSDAMAVVDNLLTAHVLAADAIHRRQPNARVTFDPAVSPVYEAGQLLTDLVHSRSLGVRAAELDDWVDERRRRHDAADPVRHRTERLARSVAAALSPYGSPGGDVGGAEPRAVIRKLRRAVPRRVVDAMWASEEPGSLNVLGACRWVPQHSLEGGHRDRFVRPVSLRSGRGGVDDDDPLFRWCRQPSRYGELPRWVLADGVGTRVHNGRPRSGGDRVELLIRRMAAAADAACQDGSLELYLVRSLVDGYEWGSYDQRFGLFGMDRSRGPKGARWMETDAAGGDAAGAFRRLVRDHRVGRDPAPAGPPALG